MRKKLFFYSLGLIISNKGFPLTLEEAINHARINSPIIQKAQSVSLEAKWKRRENFSGFLPTFFAGATHLLDKKYALTNIRFGGAQNDTIVPQIIPSTQFVLSASLPLFEGFSSLYRYQASAENDIAADNELSWNQLKTEMEVTLSFYKALGSKKLKEVAEQNLKVLQDHLKEVILFKQSGIATNYDVLRVEVQVSNAETELLNADDNIIISDQNLIEIMGKEQIKFEATGELPLLEESVLQEIANDDFYQRSDIKALKNRVSSLSYADKAQNSFWIPRLSLFGQYQYYNNLNDSFSDFSNFRSAYQVGLQATWNIFDGLSSFSRSKQTTEQFIQAEKSYRITELKAQKDFEICKRKYHFFLNLFKARNNDITKSRESVRLAREGRRVGSRTNADLLDAEADLYKSQAGAINAHLGAVEALINLQISIGKKIKKLN